MSKTILFQTIQFGISIVFVYTQLNVKNSSIPNNISTQFKWQKRFYFLIQLSMEYTV